MTERLAEPVTDRSAWRGPDFADDESWLDVLAPAEVEELDAALGVVESRGLHPLQFTRADFPLPTLAARFRAILDELENGRGFVVLRGIPVDRYAPGRLDTLYWGIATHLGDLISQNAKGDLLGRVTDLGVDYHAPNARGYTTRAALHPHNDSADLVGLLCVRKAKEGGLSTIASAMAIYNELLATRPDFLDPLYRGFHYDLRREGVTGRDDKVTTNRVPVFSYHAGRLSCRFNPKAIRTAAAKTGAPLTPLEDAALETMTALAMDPDMRLDMDLEPGDLQLLDNHMILHSRSAFTDWPEPDRRRLLLRLWVNLRPGEGRTLAPDFAARYNTGARGGVAVAVARGRPA